MFGALMGTLNSFQKQTSKDSKLAKQNEKRAEIDARVKEKVAKEKEELDATKEKVRRERREREEETKNLLESETVLRFFGRVLMW
jgi:pinin/SDK/memA/ protein conserved region